MAGFHRNLGKFLCSSKLLKKITIDFIFLRKFYNVIFMLCFISAIILVRFYTTKYHYITLQNNENRSRNIQTMACKKPRLGIWETNIRKYFKRNRPISCNEESDWVCLYNGMANVCNETRTRHTGVWCEYAFLKRASEFETVEDYHLNSSDPVYLPSDFFKVKCMDNKNKKWKNIMAGIHYDKKIHQRTGWEHVSSNAMKLNVFIWAFDSLSRLTFMRKLPKTYRFITKELNALVLKGYNIVGDGTPQALIPILTGKTELELPEVRKRLGSRAQNVDIYPFIWKDFKKSGYVTTYAEDLVCIGTFTYRLKGFLQQPTDHYIRTFYLAAEKEYSNHKPYCLRGTPRHKVFMNWVMQIFRMYKDKPIFLFGFHSELSHGDHNQVGSVDEDLRVMLKTLYKENFLNNTVLIVMSDHGHRFTQFRETQQGKQEERLPFFSFTFPPWFEEKYPQAFQNFQLNQERLTTPFDIYSTLADILNFNATQTIGDINHRSISLFKEIPFNRLCTNAGIAPHWCTCLDKKSLPIKSSIVLKAAEALVGFMNEFTEFKRDLCETLYLFSVIDAAKYVPTKDLLLYEKTKDVDGMIPQLTASTSISTEWYEIHISTHPGNGHFEATLKYKVKEDRFYVSALDISRMNKYGIDASCIEKTEPQLNPYCYCKENITVFG